MPVRVTAEETQRQKLSQVEKERAHIEELYKEEVASWLIPGGVSSGVASSAGAWSMGASMTAGSAVGSAAGMALSGGSSVAGTLGKIGENNLKHNFDSDNNS